MLKRCRYCLNEYPETDFGVAATLPNKTYRRQKCRYCYRKTKKQLIKSYRQWIEQYKQQGKCEKCDISDFRVLDFHHGYLQEKDFNISEFAHRVGFEKLKEEVGKCTLLCANCHRIEHHNERIKEISGIGAVG